MKSKKYILVTGAAGFIGFHLCNSLIKLGHRVVGLDNINDYYDVDLKYSRLLKLGIVRGNAEKYNKISVSKLHGDNFHFIKLNLQDENYLSKIFGKYRFDTVCNLAAQAGVRYSLKNPKIYLSSNIDGFLNILECSRKFGINRLVYGSSSSIYGNSDMVPFSENNIVDKPVSLYAVTKKSNELMAYTYSHLYNIETIGLRFFTVYGPWGRPDMAIFLFIESILNNKPIKVFNKGNLSRDFTYIDDIINGLIKTLIENSKNKSNYKLYNIGCSRPVKLTDFISEIEKNLGLNAVKEMLPMQPGDVNQTWADVSKIKSDYNYSPKVKLSEGVKKFIVWYKKYYKI